MKRLADIADIRPGYPFRGAIKDLADGDALAVQMKNADPVRGVDWPLVARTALTGKRDPDWLRSGDVLFAARGSRNYAVHIGVPPEKAVCSPHFFVLTSMSKNVLPKYLAWQINQQAARQYFVQEATGGYIKNIRRMVLENLPVMVPALEEQERIVELFDAAKRERLVLEGLIENRKQQLDAVAHEILGAGN